MRVIMRASITRLRVTGVLTVIAVVLCLRYVLVAFHSEFCRCKEPLDRKNEEPCRVEVAELPDHIFRDFLWHHCDLVRIGGLNTTTTKPMIRVDGSWWTCKELYQDMERSADCLVYALGCGDDVSFDVHLARLGCEVHSFDFGVIPSQLFKNADELFTKSSEIRNVSSWKHVQWNWHYHVIGVDEKDDLKNSVLSLPTIMSSLNHDKRVIHYFKVDIEGTEHALMKDIANMFHRIKSFAGEWHPTFFPGGALHQAAYRSLRQMESKGLRLIRRDFRYDLISREAFSSSDDSGPIQSDLYWKMSVLGELYFVNTNYLPRGSQLT